MKKDESYGAAHRLVKFLSVRDFAREEIKIIVYQIVAERDLMRFIVVKRIRPITLLECNLNVVWQRHSFIQGINDALKSLLIGANPSARVSFSNFAARLIVQSKLPLISCCAGVSRL